MPVEGDVTFSFPEMEPERRVQELILHIADRSQGDPAFGKVKLAKILFFADFTSYRLHGRPITGSSYVKWGKGPVPQEFYDILDEMRSANHIDVRVQPYFNREQHRVVPRREADLTFFSGRDIAVVDKIIQDFWGKNATEISDLSHGKAWEVARQNEAIPYEASLLSDEGITQEDIDRVQELMELYGVDP